MISEGNALEGSDTEASLSDVDHADAADKGDQIFRVVQQPVRLGLSSLGRKVAPDKTRPVSQHLPMVLHIINKVSYRHVILNGWCVAKINAELCFQFHNKLCRRQRIQGVQS